MGNDGEVERRRSVDPLIIEVHGMVQRLDQKMDDTHTWMKSQAEKMKTLDDRMRPIEDFHGHVKTAGKVGAIVGTPALLAVGAAIWEWIKSIFFQRIQH